jgi:hypothetical protein
MMGAEMAFFQSIPDSSNISGAIVKGDEHVPDENGSKIYLNENPNLNIS